MISLRHHHRVRFIFFCPKKTSSSNGLRSAPSTPRQYIDEVAPSPKPDLSTLSLSKKNEKRFSPFQLFFSRFEDPSTSTPPPLAAEEQQLLNAIHAHPNKRDLVLNLLRQLNESGSISGLNLNSSEQ